MVMDWDQDGKYNTDSSKAPTSADFTPEQLGTLNRLRAIFQSQGETDTRKLEAMKHWVRTRRPDAKPIREF